MPLLSSFVGTILSLYNITLSAAHHAYAAPVTVIEVARSYLFSVIGIVVPVVVAIMTIFDCTAQRFCSTIRKIWQMTVCVLKYLEFVSSSWNPNGCSRIEWVLHISDPISRSTIALSVACIIAEEFSIMVSFYFLRCFSLQKKRISLLLKFIDRNPSPVSMDDW